MALTTHLLTVSEFAQLQEDDGPVYHELHQGEVAAVTRPKWKHFLIQRSLRRLLEALSEPGSIVDTEFAFKPLPDGELRVANVAYVSAQKLGNVDPEGYFHGVPELVIEVLSASNTASDLYDRENLCLQNGGVEFWVVDPVRHQVKVSTPDRLTVTYASSQHIPLHLFGGSMLHVTDIFG